MTEQRITRRLAAVLAADIAGYSRMMHADEVQTMTALQQIWSETFNPAVTARHGRIVKMMGDGALVEFGSIVDAVECAVTIQRAMFARNLTAKQRFEFRIGINLGEVVVDREDIFGDGVNLAVRLEEQAPAGGILTSEVVYHQVAGKVGISFSDGGEIKLKNIDQLLRVWQWQADESEPASRFTPIPARLRSSDKPSIAVLPFSTMGDHPESGFFADGLVDDILTTLSKVSGLSVIARHSSFVYRGREVDVRQVARELGVRFILEGSVRKAGARIRVTTQLIDGTTGIHIWADRFDRLVDDIFAIQDEITLTLATEMQVRLTEGEQARLRYTTTTNVEAWNLWIRGLNAWRGPITAESHVQARRCWERALALDPGSAVLNAMLGLLQYADARHRFSGQDPESALNKAQTYVEQALEIDPQNADAFRTLSGILLLRSQFSEAATAARKAIKLGPNLPDVLVFGAFVLTCCGHAAEAIGHVQRAIALNPNFQSWFLGVLGNAYRLAGRTDEALAAYRAFHAREPGFGLSDIIMIQEQSGHIDEARETAAQLIATRPSFTIDHWLKTQFRCDSEQMLTDLKSLRTAGLPEQ